MPSWPAGLAREGRLAVVDFASQPPDVDLNKVSPGLELIFPHVPAELRSWGLTRLSFVPPRVPASRLPILSCRLKLAVGHLTLSTSTRPRTIIGFS